MKNTDSLDTFGFDELVNLKEYLLEQAKLEDNISDYMRVIEDLYRVMKELDRRWEGK